MGRIPREPSHQVAVDIVCGPDPNDYKVAALLYDMETANILQEGDWFLLATHHLFRERVLRIVQRAKERVPYAVGVARATDIKSIVDAKDDPNKLYDVLHKVAGP